MKSRSKLTIVKEVLFYALGVLLIGSFVYLYSTRFTLDRVVPPAVHFLYHWIGIGWTIAINAGVFLLFLLFLPYRGKIEWRSKGTFAAFILALMAEMFGVPLLLYIISPFFGFHLPPHIWIRGRPVSWNLLNFLEDMFSFGWPGMVVGAWMTAVGMILVVIGWIQIHRATKLVTTGLYKYVRHPQYTGLGLVITGWILHWSTSLTVLLYPVLLFVYYRLARGEEAELVREFGQEYETYRQATPMFLPIKRKRRQPESFQTETT